MISGWARRVAGILACGIVVPPAGAAAAPGDLDTAFGTAGFVELVDGTQLAAAATQPDGKLVAVGLRGGISSPQALVVRVLPSGELDPAFGIGGTSTVPVPADATGTVGRAVALQGDGKIVVLADIKGTSGDDGVQITRMLANGTLDTSFGVLGSRNALRGAAVQGRGGAVAVRPGGEIVVGGASAPDGTSIPTATIARFSEAGALVDLDTLDAGESFIADIALQPDGKIAFVGTARVGQGFAAVIGRAGADGARDPSFRDGGVHVESLARDAAASGLRHAALLPDGRLLAVGYAFNGTGGGTGGADQVTVKVDGAGQPDLSYGPGGTRYATSARGPRVDAQQRPGGAGLALAGSRFYSGGSWDDSGTNAFALRAQALSGELDTAFGSGGLTVTPVRNYITTAFGSDIALAAEGLYSVGTTGDPTRDRTTGIVARHRPVPDSVPPATTPPPTTTSPTPTTTSTTPAPTTTSTTTVTSTTTTTPAPTSTTTTSAAPPRVRPTRVRATVRRAGARRFVVTGNVTVPESVLAGGRSRASICAQRGSRVAITTKRGATTLSVRRGDLRSTCTFSIPVNFTSDRRFGRARSLRFVARFGGNRSLLPRAAPTVTVRLRRR